MKKPNIVLCLCDQLRPFELGCYGGEVDTPNIDKLARDGAVFENAITNAPVCSPARSSLIQGQYSRTCIGVVDNMHAEKGPQNNRCERLKDASIAEVLKTQGYKTALIGKWHIYSNPDELGFDEYVYPDAMHKYMNQKYHDNQGDYLVDTFSNDFELDKFEHIVSQSKEPFFIYYNISLPHQPLIEGVPKYYQEKYQDSKVSIRENASQNDEYANSDFWFKVYAYSDYFQKKYCGEEIDEQDYKLKEGFNLEDLTRLYYGGVKCVDDTVGRMIDVLKASKVMDDTIFIFLSDHGDNLGSHNMFNKDCIYEESIRIPMIFHYKKSIKPQRNDKQIAQIIDVMPTVIELAGGAIPDSAQGNSLKRVLHGDTEHVGEGHVFIETPLKEICIRNDRYKFGMVIGDDGKTIIDEDYCLYDLKLDEYEVNNKSADENYLDIKLELKEKLWGWHTDTVYLDTEYGSKPYALEKHQLYGDD